MNTPQKFFGFLLLPVLTFILGFSLADTGSVSPQSSWERAQKVSFSESTETIDIDVFEDVLTALESKNIELVSKGDLQDFEENIESVKQLVEHLQKMNLDIFWEAVAEIEDNYIDPDTITFKKLTEGAIFGMVLSLGDPYSTYLTKAETEVFDAGLAGELEGIGAELTMKNGFVIVVSPLKNSPAAQAGLLPEDIVVQIDGEDIQDKSLTEVVERIKGKKGTSVILTIIRKTSPDLIEITIVRDQILIESVRLNMNDDIAVLEVSQFGDRTQEEFEAAIREIIEEGAKGIVLDLRFNPGGYLETAVQMVSAFVKEGKVVVEKERAPSVTNRFVTGKVLTDKPVVVLINRGSASASEIVAGALQDHERALVVGEPSFGKGTVQEIAPLSDGSNLRITVAKWLTPKGRDISEQGIQPDILITRTAEDYENGTDPQLDAALKILRGELDADELRTADAAANATEE